MDFCDDDSGPYEDPIGDIVSAVLDGDTWIGEEEISRLGDGVDLLVAELARHGLGLERRKNDWGVVNLLRQMVASARRRWPQYRVHGDEGVTTGADGYTVTLYGLTLHDAQTGSIVAHAFFCRTTDDALRIVSAALHDIKKEAA